MSHFRKKRIQKKIGKRGLIVCEGETEENYFKGLITEDVYKRKFQAIDVSIFKPKDHSPVGLINEGKRRLKEAKKEGNPYDFVWAIFDKDGHAKIPDAFDLALNTKPQIRIAFTIPCFEFFVLLHFERTTKPFRKGDEVISQIQKKWFKDYKKATNIFEQLQVRKKIGIANSKWVVERSKVDLNNGVKIYDLPAYSNVHELIEFLYDVIK
tara:strand:+ start:1633 stop:2262 length:630 start_codon:yes stop_codon:yes gene_type:complete